MKRIIYALVDPTSDEIRYIGKSGTGFRRACAHRAPSNLKAPTHKNRWILSLHAKGLTYTIRVLEEEPLDGLNGAECRWIQIGRLEGWPLTNATDGGDGQSLGYRTSPEVRAKISAALKGRLTSLQTRVKLAAATKDCWKRSDFREKQTVLITASWKKRKRTPMSEEARNHISGEMVAQWATPELRAARLRGVLKGVAKAAQNRAEVRKDPAVMAARRERKRFRNRLWMRGYKKRKKAQQTEKEVLEL